MSILGTMEEYGIVVFPVYCGLMPGVFTLALWYGVSPWVFVPVWTVGALVVLWITVHGEEAVTKRPFSDGGPRLR